MSKNILTILQRACKGIHISLVGGACCCGKSTLAGIATMLLAPFGVEMLDTSGIITHEIRKRTRLGRIFTRYQDGAAKGGLMPDQETMEAVAKHVNFARRNGKKRVIIVGTPRTERQAEWIVDSGIDYGAIHLKSTPERLQRNLARRNRPDDRWFKERMEIYSTKTVPAFELLQVGCPENQFLDIDLDSPINAITSIAGLCLNWHPPSFGEIIQNLNCEDHPAVKRLSALTSPT